MKSGNRVQWIDVAKGICMLSVIAGHLGVASINRIVFSYHLTVFFILSGYMLKNNLSVDSLSRKFKSLMTPYFVTCIAVAIMNIFNMIVLRRKATIAAITQVIGYDLIRSFMASGTIKSFGTIDIGGFIGAVWFLPATFFATLIVQILLKYVQNKKERYVITISLALLSCVSAQFIWFPFSIQSAFLAAPLLLLGYDCKQNGTLEKLSLKHVLMCAIIFVGGILLKISPVYYVTASMPDYLLSMICALASSVCVIYFAHTLAKNRILNWIGRHSIFYLCIHLFEMETMGTWFRVVLGALGLPVNALTHLLIKLTFITVVTLILILFRKLNNNAKKNRQPIKFQMKRDLSLDIAKAFLIILMIVGHSSVAMQFRSIVYSFHMVAFVFFSGYCFRPNRCKSLLEIIRKDMNRFLVPYALFGFGYMLLTHDGGLIELKRIIFGISFTKNLFSDVASIGPVYFILLLFLTKEIYLLIEHFVHDELLKALTVLGISLSGYYLGKTGYWLPWSADCAMYAIAFYYLGYCFKKYKIMEYISNRSYFYFVLSSIWAYMIYKGSMEIAIRNYGNFGLVIMGSISASVLLYMACSYLCREWNRWVVRMICLVGENTMYILIVHKLFGGYTSQIASISLTNGSVYHVASMVLMQLIIGVALGTLVIRIKNTFRVRTALK